MLEFATKWVIGIFLPPFYSKIHERIKKSGFCSDFRDNFKASKTISEGYFLTSSKVLGIFYSIGL